VLFVTKWQAAGLEKPPQ